MARYPWDLLPRLGSAVEHRQAEAAHRHLDDLLGIVWQQSRRKLPLGKMRCAAISSFCSRGALEGGAPSEKILRIQLAYLDRLTALRSWPRVCQITHRYADDLIAEIRAEHAGTMEQIVARVRRIMRQSLPSAPSLAEHAVAFRVSPSHLSRSFTAIAGQTFQEETRRLRLARARQLLLESAWKIATVSHEVGYPDTSRFIREFRRHFGVTPGRFRALHHAR